MDGVEVVAIDYTAKTATVKPHGAKTDEMISALEAKGYGASVHE